jgi:CheY-like chemotaxis protein
VILDQYMPGMNGSEVAKRIRKIDPAVPLIAITSDDSQVPVLEAAGFDRVFLKPLRGQDYIETILRYL